MCDPSKNNTSSGGVTLRSVIGDVEVSNTSMKVSFDLNVNSGQYIMPDYPYNPYSNSSDAPFLNWNDNRSLNLSQVLSNGREISWKVRLFDKYSLLGGGAYKATTQVAYGTINSVSTYQYNSVSYTRLTVFPHMNIYMDTLVGIKNIQTRLPGVDDDPNGYAKANILSILRNCDPNMRYYIEINGMQYPITHYSYVPIETGLISEWDEYFDAYGNPVNGYIGIEGTGLSIQSDTTYKIYCNYIDSKSTYFDVYSDAVITVKENLGTTLTSSNCALDNPYVINYCNLELDISYSQAQGVYSNYFNYSVKRYNPSSGEYEFVYNSGNLYNQQLHCSFNKLLPDSVYQVIINIIDTQQRSYVRELYFKTDYSYADTNVSAKAEYYNAHNSIIIDWSEVYSIMPNEDSSDCVFVNLSDNGTVSSSSPHNAVQIPENTTLTYMTNNSGESLNLENCTFAFVFKGTDITRGVITQISDGKGFYAVVSYNSGILRIQSTVYSYSYNLYGEYDQDDFIQALSVSNVNSVDVPVPFIWGDANVDFDNIEWNDDYYWHEEDLIANSVFMVAINRDDCAVKNVTTNQTISAINNHSRYAGYPDQGYVAISGSAIFKYLYVVNNVDTGIVDDLINKGYSQWTWDEKTVLLCSFADSLNGSSSNVEWGDVAGYRVYKTLGTSNYLYEIGNIDGADNRILEDFAVGDNCEYTYYIYPILKSAGNSNTYYLGTVVQTNTVVLNTGVDKVFGLREIKPSDGSVSIFPTYEVDTEQVWRLYLNLEDSGFTLHTDKTFYDTLATYSQEFIGNRKYISKSISALIGDVDCSFDGNPIWDDYDILTSWNDFSSSSNLKCLIDKRGLILPGNFEADPTIEYLDVEGDPAVAKFNWRQKADLQIINIYGRLLPFNPIKELYLSDLDDLSLVSSDTKYLTVGRGDH